MDTEHFTRYVIMLNTIPGVSTPEGLISGHIRYLRALDQAGKLVLCGPFADHRGGMVIIKAASEAEANAIAQTDPFVAEGVRDFEVRTWLLSCEENNHLGRG